MIGPKNTGVVFFGAFSTHAAKSVEAAHWLVELVHGLDVADAALERGRVLYTKIKAAESDADSITSAMAKVRSTSQRAPPGG